MRYTYRTAIRYSALQKTQAALTKKVQRGTFFVTAGDKALILRAFRRAARDRPMLFRRPEAG